MSDVYADEEPGHADPAHPDPGHPDTGPRTQVPGHPDLGHSDPGHPDRGHPDPGHPDPGHPDPGHPDPSFPRHVIFCFGFAIQPVYNVYYVLSLILGMLFQMISKEIRDRLIEFESENCDASYIARQKDFEINELTIAANDLRGNIF
ncbi:unnamed protein product [Caenorhabditis nigoni]